jgi:DNA-binding FadR family transcriptional regulator
MPPDKPRQAPVFERIMPRRAFEEICHRIRVKLASGALRPGDKLPPERELALQFGVSRHALREALRSLENAGVVMLERGPRGGAFICTGDTGSLTQAMRDMVSLGTLTLPELTEARVYLLDGVVRLACERADAENLAAIDANVERTAAAVKALDYDRWLESVLEFYLLLASATKNQVMRVLVESMSAIVEHLMINMRYPPELLLESRRRFARHLRARDSDAAAEEMKAHLTRMRDHGQRQGDGTVAR